MNALDERPEIEKHRTIAYLLRNADISWNIKRNFEYYGIYPRCKKCGLTCKQPNVKGLIKLECPMTLYRENSQRLNIKMRTLKECDYEKMDISIKPLYELSRGLNLSPRKIAPLLNVGMTTIYHWFWGISKPTKYHKKNIKEGMEKIKMLKRNE